MISSITKLILAALVFNAVSVFGAPMRLTEARAAVEVKDTTELPTRPVTRSIVDIPVPRDSPALGKRSRTRNTSRRLARLASSREPAPDQPFIEARDTGGTLEVPRTGHLREHVPQEPHQRRYPRRVYYEYYEKRAPPLGDPAVKRDQSNSGEVNVARHEQDGMNNVIQPRCPCASGDGSGSNLRNALSTARLDPRCACENHGSEAAASAGTTDSPTNAETAVVSTPCPPTTAPTPTGIPSDPSNGNSSPTDGNSPPADQPSATTEATPTAGSDPAPCSPAEVTESPSTETIFGSTPGGTSGASTATRSVPSHPHASHTKTATGTATETGKGPCSHHHHHTHTHSAPAPGTTAPTPTPTSDPTTAVPSNTTVTMTDTVTAPTVTRTDTVTGPTVTKDTTVTATQTVTGPTVTSDATVTATQTVTDTVSATATPTAGSDPSPAANPSSPSTDKPTVTDPGSTPSPSAAETDPEGSASPSNTSDPSPSATNEGSDPGSDPTATPTADGNELKAASRALKRDTEVEERNTGDKGEGGHRGQQENSPENKHKGKEKGTGTHHGNSKASITGRDHETGDPKHNHSAPGPENDPGTGSNNEPRSESPPPPPGSDPNQRRSHTTNGASSEPSVPPPDPRHVSRAIDSARLRCMFSRMLDKFIVKRQLGYSGAAFASHVRSIGG
ncbi:hypothetical protein AX17_006528 [Amanita inopinata Kibby_2008]|nr:hypothetical protein AX17_006528 [Amanita inopinata Kibby_2008]